MRYMPVATLAVFGVLAAPSAVVAQSGDLKSFAGVWHGTIENYSWDTNANRELFVDPDGSCRWDYAKVNRRRGPDKADCRIDPAAGKIEIATSGKSQVNLTLHGDELKGTFLAYYHGGRTPFSITMKRGRAP